MNPTVAQRLEQTLVLLIALSFALPVPLGWVLLAPQTQVPATAWLRNSTLGGVQVEPAKVALSGPAVLSAKFQDAFAKNYDFHFAGRELLIRLINEIYLRVFQVSYADVLVGPNRSLLKKPFADEYCLLRGGKEMFLPLVEDLRRIQDFSDARGTAFAFVITPNKAAIYPEGLPASWLRCYRPEPRYYDRFVSLLQEKGIRYVDGHRITAAMKQSAPVPLFPLGGGHWGDLAALATGNALLDVLAGRGLNVRPIQKYRSTTSNDPKLQDYDMVNMINIVFPLHYPVTTITVEPMAPRGSYHPNIVFVGGSFLQSIMKSLDESRQFSELDYYFYYNLSQRCRADGELYQIGTPTPPVNFETDIFAADALVLEVNEEYLFTKAELLQKFLHDALAVLPDPRQPKSPFHYETWINYQWGDTLSLVVDRQPINVAALGGFTRLTPIGAYTVGPLATIRLHAPPAGQDMVLEVDATAFLVDTRLPQQKVSVSANGHVLGDWVWEAGTPARHELVIPKDCFDDGGDLRLEFHVAHPASPAEFGLSVDVSKYGIIVSSVRVHAAPR